MTTCQKIGELIAAAGALLDMDETLRGSSMAVHAEKARLLSADVSEAARGMIGDALKEDADTLQKVNLLNYAIKLDGAHSSLVAQVATALSTTIYVECS